MTRSTTITVQALHTAQHRAVRRLIDADRLPGQPRTSPLSLAEALAGRSPIDGSFWSELTDLRHHVALDDTGDVVGVIATGWRDRDSTAVVPWMHASEDTAIGRELLAAALQRFGTAPAEAFGFATALGLGLEALPVTHRAGTAAALRAAGFTGQDLWNYMVLPDQAMSALLAGGDRGNPVRLEVQQRRLGWQILARDGDQMLGEIEIDAPVQGSSRISWLEVEPPARGAGLGHVLLRAGLGHAHQAGARRAVLYVDDDEPGTVRDRGAATALYRRSGFCDVDRLHTFHRA